MNKDSADVWGVSGACQSLSSISPKHLSTTTNGLVFHYRPVVSEPILGALENSYIFLNVCFAISISFHKFWC